MASSSSYSSESLETWRKALVEACEIAGWETKNIANGHESKGIKEIADTISDKLFSIDEDLAAIRACMEEFEANLNFASDVLEDVVDLFTEGIDLFFEL
ncbi:hypothetical protein QVD17_16211 [Tagetes erecta]|uniref:Uncharacterized protein n=1 Tax=Tagetes erecta TaxID=13708 RepID=A0AAD8KRQ4_TARER|nr:hypothetical protein QVD17_16211 [Tagetes erecta]